MNIKEIADLEKSNRNYIYFFATEDEDFIAYELSAFLLARLYPSIQLEWKDFHIANGPLLIARFSLNFCKDNFCNGNTLVGNDWVRVELEDVMSCESWINEFKNLR